MKIKLPPVPKPVLKLVGRPLLHAQAHSPEVLLVAGIAGVVGATVLACRATLKVDDVLSEGLTKAENIKTVEKNEHYTEVDATKDLAILKVMTARRLVRLYAPAVGLGIVSVGALVGSHRILSTRNAGLAAAYTALDKGFSQYRDRVMKEFGPEKERELRYGGNELVYTKDEKTGELQRDLPGGVDTSIYARFFDENSKNWNTTTSYNQFFVQAQQNYMNDLLRVRGHVFLNEVYDALGLERSKAGAVVGWVRGHGDNYIDFGVFEGDQWSAMRFVNGDESSILLDFNVDGVILDLI